MKTVVGMFNNVNEAQRSFEDLMKFGVGPNDISVVTNQLAAKRGDGLRLTEVQVPDAGPIAARGPIATSLSRDPRGLMSTLQSAGVSPALAEHYVKAVRHGETLEFVVVEDRNADRIVEIMRRHAALYSAADTSETSQAPTAAAPVAAAPVAAAAAPRAGGPIERAKEAMTDRLGPRGRDGGERERELFEERIIPVLREDLQVGKREVERGAVHVGVYVTERPVSEHVLLREEHVEIERRPIDRAPRPDELEFRNGNIDMIERGEEAVVSKQVRVVEEVRVHKRVTEHDETINDKLRSTRVDIDKGDRSAYASHHASLGLSGSYDDAQPAYEYGRGLRRSRGERWEDIEANARSRWETQHPGTWSRFREAIHYAWSRAKDPNEK